MTKSDRRCKSKFDSIRNLFFKFFKLFAPFLQEGDEVREEQEKGNGERHRRDRTAHEDVKATLRHEERLAQVVLEERPHDKGEHERGSLVAELPHEIADSRRTGS